MLIAFSRANRIPEITGLFIWRAVEASTMRKGDRLAYPWLPMNIEWSTQAIIH